MRPLLVIVVEVRTHQVIVLVLRRGVDGTLAARYQFSGGFEPGNGDVRLRRRPTWWLGYFREAEAVFDDQKYGHQRPYHPIDSVCPNPGRRRTVHHIPEYGKRTIRVFMTGGQSFPVRLAR